MSNFTIEKNANKKFILSINNFNGQLREIIYSQIMNFSGVDNAFFEVKLFYIFKKCGNVRNLKILIKFLKYF